MKAALVWVSVVMAVLTASALTALGAEPRNVLVNSGFETGLSGWSREGRVERETTAALEGRGSLRLGPGKAAVRQRHAVPGLGIVYFGATVRINSPAVSGRVRARCYDAKGRLVMGLTQELDPKKAASEKGEEVGLYFKTQAHTATLEVSIEKESADAGHLYADKAALLDYDRDRKPTPAPTCDLDQYLEPLWKTKTISNETVLLVAEEGKPATGTLLLPPTRLLAVRDYSLRTRYAEGVDFTLQGRRISCTPGSRLPTVKAADLPAEGRSDFPWYDIAGKQVVVSYTRDEPWRGPVPSYQGDRLPRTLQKLTHRRPLTIVAYGDSITLGINVSGYLQIPPYMPTWAELFVRALRTHYHHGAIRIYNTALGGMTSEWGVENADSAVASLDPDLVIIAFGMNDFWSVSPEDFRRNVQTIMHRVRVRRPSAEFILVSSMPFDPAYTSDPTYVQSLASYPAALRSLAGKGVAFVDMYALAGALYTAKKPKDLLSDPMHPNDFLARWYAQALTALLVR